MQHADTERERHRAAIKTVDADLAWMTPAERLAMRTRVVSVDDQPWSRREGGAGSRKRR